LKPGAGICMDGVFEMVPFYERGGFESAFRDVRFEGVAVGASAADAILLGGSDFPEIAIYDRAFVPAAREAFLSRWIAAPGVITAGVREKGKLVGYGVVRPCRVGYKIGPLFAERAEIAELIARNLMRGIPGQNVQMDLPEANASAVDMAERFGFKMSFGCMRLYYGPRTALPIERTFAITSLEFG
jgi:hypothetical protein